MPFSTTLQSDSESISKFVKNVGIRNKGSAKQYQSRLLFFEHFAKDFYNDSKSNNNLDKLIQQLQNKELDPTIHDSNTVVVLPMKSKSSRNRRAKIDWIKNIRPGANRSRDYIDVDSDLRTQLSKGKNLISYNSTNDEFEG